MHRSLKITETTLHYQAIGKRITKMMINPFQVVIHFTIHEFSFPEANQTLAYKLNTQN